MRKNRTRTILVPTDFSRGALQAVRYAVRLAKKDNSKVLLLHVYNLAYVDPDLPFRFVAAEAVKIRKEAKMHMDKLCEEIKKKDGVRCSFLVKEGFPVDSIRNIITDKKISLVVMGTKGASGLKEIFAGSNTVKVIDKAGCPVLAVPEKAAPGAIRNIVYASDYLPSDLQEITQLNELTASFKAHITVLHVSDAGKMEKFEREAIAAFLEKVHQATGRSDISFVRLSGKDASEGISRYMDENNADLLAVSAHKRTLFDKLFNKSVTRKIVHHIRVPLLVFHHIKKHR